MGVKMKKNLSLTAALFLSFLFFSCATSVPVTVVRPAELDIGNAKTICILPFQTSSSYSKSNFKESGNIVIDVLQILVKPSVPAKPEEEKAGRYLTQKLTALVLDSPYVTVVGTSAVQSALNAGTKVPCDVYLTGEIYDYDEYLEEDETSVRRDDGTYEKRREVRKVVKANVAYTVIDANTNRMLASKRESLYESSSWERSPHDLPPSDMLLETDLEYLAKKIARQIQPYTVTVYCELLEDKTKNQTLSTADKLADQGLIEESLQMFCEYYEETGNFTAGYNSAKLYEAQGNLAAARSILSELVKTTGDSRAIKALRHIEDEIYQANRLNSQINGN
jgi:hypothetical protein